MKTEPYGLSREELASARKELRAAKALGFIPEDGLAAMEERCRAHNECIHQKLTHGEIVYGMTHFSVPAYLQYELTRFRLDFLSGKAQNYAYPEITEEEKRAFFHSRPKLFVRCEGNSFTYEDSEAIIEKRILEEAYQNYVQSMSL